MNTVAPTADPREPVEFYAAVTDEIVAIPSEFPQRRNWWIGFAFSLTLLFLFFVCLGKLFIEGVGIWGNNIPVTWGFPIINYVWWLGIGHAGTFISAFLLLVEQHWRNSLNRFAEAMTMFSVAIAGIYPCIHLGRPWFLYWMAPYFSTMGVWPQFRSPLAWDFFAVLVYLLVSVLFWYIGILPDLASARDSAAKRGWQIFFGLISLGWRGEARQWVRWRRCYRLVAMLAVPLVVSVASEYSFLFSSSVLAGWHSTVFPPYFVLGAIFSGFGVVSMLSIVLRSAFHLENLITERHLGLLGLMLLVTGFLTSYGYAADVFFAYYGGDPREIQYWMNAWFGHLWWGYWGAVGLNFIPLQALWFRTVRRNPLALFLISSCVVVGMWCERFMIVTTGLQHEPLASSWGLYTPSLWDWLTFAGSVGVFLTPYFLFIRFLPMSSAHEMKKTAYEESEHSQ